MHSRSPMRVAALILLVVAGAVVTRYWLTTPQAPAAEQVTPSIALQPLDLFVQLALMLVCALGIRALLPSGQDPEEEAPDDDRR